MEWFKGKKTYISGGLAILAALAGFLTGEITAPVAIGAAWAAVQTWFIRAGVAKAGNGA